jgi:hypothetical protein
MRAKFIIIEDTPEVLCIRDVGGPRDMSVTNDAEAVVESLAGRLGNRRLEYYDSQGVRDELGVRNGKFDGFVPGLYARCHQGKRGYVADRDESQT